MKYTESKSHKLQILRGLAIIAVVFIHNIPGGGMLQIFSRPFLNFSVGLFLFLSGMLSNANNWNPKKRLIKVLVPYIFWTLIYVVLGNIKTSALIPIKFAEGLVTGNAAAIMYYIFVYCELTLLMPLIDKLAKSKYKYLGFFISPLEIVIMRLIPLIIGFEMNNYVSILMSISCFGWFTYYYIGYSLGNDIIHIKTSTKKLVCFWVGAIILQMLEGYWYFSMGEVNCGTQIKLSAILAGTIFLLIAYRFIEAEKRISVPFLQLLGDHSFGIYFSHLAIIAVLNQVTLYTKYVLYPINAIVVVILSLICVMLGKKIMGKFGKYLAL